MGGFILARLMVSDPQRFLSATLGGSGGIRQGFPLWAWTERLSGLLSQGMSYPEANIVAAPIALHRPFNRRGTDADSGPARLQRSAGHGGRD